MSTMVNNEYQHNNLLSICIPTYKRCEKLKENLTTMILKVREYNICFFISDNASPDGTQEVVKEIQAQYPHIIYSRNINNMGADRNIEIVLKLSDTKYRWLMGDDDFMEGNNIEDIMNVIKNQYDLILLNFPNKRFLKETKEYTNMNQLLFEKGAHMTCISSLIFSDMIIKNGDFKRFYDTNFVHLGVIFKYLSEQDSRVLFLSNIIVKCLPNRQNSFSDKVFRFFAIDLNTVMKMLPDFYIKKSKRGAIRKIVTDHFGYIGYLINARIYKEINIIKFFKYYREILIAFPPLGVIMVFISSITPIWLLKWMKKMWKLMKVSSLLRTIKYSLKRIMLRN